MIFFMVDYIGGIMCRPSSCEGMYMWMGGKGLRHLLVMLIIWRYGDNSSGDSLRHCWRRQSIYVS